MVSVDEHLERILAQVRRPDPIELALLDAQGLLCAEEVVAESQLPGFDNSQVDGYAVRAGDLAQATEPRRRCSRSWATYRPDPPHRKGSATGSACGS